MPEQSQPKRITPQEFVERLHLKVKYKLATLDAEFIEQARTVDSAGLLDLLEDHFVKRFDVWALASAPFAKSETCLGVHPAYLESLNAAKDRILFELSSEMRSLPPDLHEELRARVVLRLTARSQRYWAEAGIILLNTANSVPYIVTLDVDSEPGALAEDAVTGVSPTTIVRKKRGPITDYATAERVAEIVCRIAGKEKWQSHIDDISEELDDKEVPCPKPWKGRGYRSWTDCLEPQLVIKAITHHLKRAKEKRTESIA